MKDSYTPPSGPRMRLGGLACGVFGAALPLGRMSGQAKAGRASGLRSWAVAWELGDLTPDVLRVETLILRYVWIWGSRRNNLR